MFFTFKGMYCRFLAIVKTENFVR